MNPTAHYNIPMAKKQYIMGIHDLEKRTPGIQNPDLEDDGFPLHITLTPPATGKIIVENVLTEFQRIASNNEPFDIRPTGMVDFGTRESPFPVLQFERTPQIVKIHNELITALQKLDLLVDTTWIGEKYNPHSTPLNPAEFKDEVLIFDRISAVERRDDKLIVYPPFMLQQ